jgi:predicted SAM-dependent methyltransferase
MSADIEYMRTQGKRILNIGCGPKPPKIPGFVNLDMFPYQNVHIVADLNKQWPMADNSFDGIMALNILEHLPDKIHSMNEAFRVLKHKGLLFALVPDVGKSPWAFADPTHVSYWNKESFYHFTQNYTNFIPQWYKWDTYKESTGIRCLFSLADWEHDNEGNLRIQLRAEKEAT